LKAAVIGLGRAGLPLAAVMADSGIKVTGYDIDKGKVALINSGENPIPEEAGLKKLIRKHIGKNLKATADIMDAADASAYIVIVPLFLDGKNKPDYAILKKALKTISKVLKDGDLVVLETTVPPGTTDGLLREILDKTGKKYHLAYSPERIMTGVSISRFREFPKIVGGTTKKATEKAYNLYRRFSKNVAKVRDAKTAEFVKVAEGIYRDVNISLANELYRVCEKKGIDFWDMRQAAKHRYCDIHEPGMVGGHCIPVYPWFLINHERVPLIRLARKLNDEMASYYADRAREKTKGKNAGIIGLSYREGVKEASHTRAHALIKELQKRGFTVYGQDPQFTEEEIKKHFKIKPIKKEMDVIILANKIQKKLDKKKTIDVKNTLSR
jgi:UDP-N-acetyl-D-mannosaminuronic acid dehydrogenase